MQATKARSNRKVPLPMDVDAIEVRANGQRKGKGRQGQRPRAQGRAKTGGRGRDKGHGKKGNQDTSTDATACFSGGRRGHVAKDCETEEFHLYLKCQFVHVVAFSSMHVCTGTNVSAQPSLSSTSKLSLTRSVTFTSRCVRLGGQCLRRSSDGSELGREERHRSYAILSCLQHGRR